MRVVLQSDVRSRPVAIQDVNHLAIYDDNGQDLLAVMWRREDGTLALTRIGEQDFERLCSEMGLQKRTDVRVVNL